MSNEEEKRCPLCAEEMDWTDQQLKPCKCGYQVCVWCWHHIMDMAEKDETEGRCPACRTPYDKEKIVGMQASFERAATCNSSRKQKPPKAKPKTTEGRKDLTNIRVIQRRMAYVIGLPLSLADEDLLQRKEYFGQYGKVTKVSLSRTAGGAIQQFVNDTCSVYITYSKEEEAIRCIQSVHGFVLEGRFLRASFGTAKYCHAWLRNMPCNNPACLYLHSIGAEEDSFGKDEVAAVHTRSRVQQIVGATHNLQRRAGNLLPPPIDELHNISNATSSEKSFYKSALQDSSVSSGGHLTCLLSSNDNDDGSRAPSKMTTFVDIVGRSSSSGAEKEGNFMEDRRMFDLCSEFSSVTLDKDGHVEVEPSDPMLCRVSSSSHLVNGLTRNIEFKEPFRELPNYSALGRADLPSNDASLIKEQSSLMLDSRRQVLHGLREDLRLFDDPRLKDSDSSSQAKSFFSSSFPTKVSQDSIDLTWQHRDSCSLGNFDADCNNVHNHVDEDSIQFKCVNSILNDGFNERKFQSSAKSDRIYRSSNSFSNEEIVEHLRRLDDNLNVDESPALDAVESSIISNILSMDFDACEDSLNLPCGSAGFFDGQDRNHGSSWNFHDQDQLGFSFVKQEGFVNQVTDSESSFGNKDYPSKNFSSVQDSGESRDHYLHKPLYNASRPHNLTPPGFSVSPRDPPPGFSASRKTDQVLCLPSGSHLVNTSLSNNHYRTPSTGSISNAGDLDLNDTAILMRGKTTNGLNTPGSDVQASYTSQSNALEDDARLWFLMQQSTNMHQDSKFSQMYMQQAPSSHQELRYSARIGDEYSAVDDHHGISSMLMDQHQTYNYSSFAQLSQQKYSNGHILNGYQPSLDEVQLRGEAGMADLQRNERLGFNRFCTGHGDLMFQMPSSGDVYTRVFGM